MVFKLHCQTILNTHDFRAFIRDTMDIPGKMKSNKRMAGNLSGKAGE